MLQYCLPLIDYIASCRTSYKKVSEELLDLLTTPSSTAAGNSKDSTAQQQRDSKARVDEVLDVLVACEGVAFNEQLLAGGPWLVSALQLLWQRRTHYWLLV